MRDTAAAAASATVNANVCSYFRGGHIYLPYMMSTQSSVRHSVLWILTRSAMTVFVVASKARPCGRHITYYYGTVKPKSAIDSRVSAIRHCRLGLRFIRGVYLFTNIWRHTRHQWRESLGRGDVEKKSRRVFGREQMVFCLCLL